MKKIKSFILLLLVATTTLAESSVSFDRTGQMHLPDRLLLQKANQAAKDSRPDEVAEWLLKAARYGSDQAKAALALHHIDRGEVENGLAWLMLLAEHNPKTTNWQHIIEPLEQQLGADELTTAQLKTTQLTQAYGPVAALQHRQDWRQNLRFTGSRIAGHIPNNLTVIPVEDGRPGTLTINLTGQQIRQQLDAFVNAYQNDNQVKKQTLMALMKLTRNK